VRAYQIVLHEEAWAALASVSRPKQKRILRLLEQLQSDPFRQGEFQERDAAGRGNEVTLLEEWMVTFWSDHAAKEIRVLRLEHAAED
jgi:hypothetical protein